MIRVTIEMLPKGVESEARIMAQGVIVNDGSGTTSRGNYMYGLTRQTNTGSDPGIGYQGNVRNFPRRKNVWHLLKTVLDNALD